MERFFNAQSVTVIGVSNSPTNLGRTIVFNLLRYQFNGVIYLVGSKGGSFLGFKIYKSVLDIPEATDLAAILVPARSVPQVLEECGKKGIKRIVVESAGFRELGEDRRNLENNILSIIDRYNMKLIGPNCIGIINRHSGLAVPFMPIEPEAPRGRIGIISQSGGVGGSILNSLGAEKLGYSLFASIGNKLQSNECDVLEYYLEDPKTDAIFCYLEGIADGRRFMKLAMTSSKPIILQKSNRSEVSRNIAKSHSASLAVDDTVVSAACRQAGVIRVEDQTEAFAILKGFLLPPVRGNRLGIISRSGGHAVIAADAADKYGFNLPDFPSKIIDMVEKHSRAGVIRFQNPLDLGDVFDLDFYTALAEEVLKSPDFDCLLFIHHYQGLFDAEASRNLVKKLPEVAKNTGKPVAICLFTPEKELKINIENVRFPIFTDPYDAMKALAASRDFFNREIYTFSDKRPKGLFPERANAMLQCRNGKAPDVVWAGKVLEDYGFSLIPWRYCEDENSVIAAARDFGFPVVLKTAAPNIIHKSDTGGVVVDINNENELRRAYERVSSLGKAVIVQKMMKEFAVEWIIGGKRDPYFGPVVLTGMGGIYVEAIRDISIRVAPISVEEARKMIFDTRGSKLLAGFRGHPKLDINSLAELISKVSWFLEDCSDVSEIDFNPVFVTEKGVTIADWRFSLCGDSHSAQNL